MRKNGHKEGGKEGREGEGTHKQASRRLINERLIKHKYFVYSLQAAFHNCYLPDFNKTRGQMVS